MFQYISIKMKQLPDVLSLVNLINFKNKQIKNHLNILKF
jgi:hypothetical protein